MSTSQENSARSAINAWGSISYNLSSDQVGYSTYRGDLVILTRHSNSANLRGVVAIGVGSVNANYRTNNVDVHTFTFNFITEVFIMKVGIDVRPKQDKKVIFENPNFFTIKYVRDGVTEVLGVNIEHGKKNINYVSNEHAINSTPRIFFMVKRDSSMSLQRYYDNIDTIYVQGVLPTDTSDYPYYLHVGEGETETPETADITILYPPPKRQSSFLNASMRGCCT